MQPILHLSLPVRDLEEARDFYVRTLGCQAARQRDDFIDVWFFGLQLTLQDRPNEVSALVPGSSRHFGVTLGHEEFEALVERLQKSGVEWVVRVTTDDVGLLTEQTKAKIVDPSGNVIEVKTYRDVEAALEISTHSYPQTVARGN
ncbi:MAG TPA: VOC family protein [Acidimicrobiales bacterium]|nr:VOC family protein [Acidimicrobiales bacterium]